MWQAKFIVELKSTPWLLTLLDSYNLTSDILKKFILWNYEIYYRIMFWNSTKYHKQSSWFRTIEINIVVLYSIKTSTIIIVHGHIALKCDDFFDINVNSVTRGHNLKLSVKCSSLNVRQHFFTNRVVAPWNFLASGVVNAVSVQSFKQMLKGQVLSCFVSS